MKGIVIATAFLDITTFIRLWGNTRIVIAHIGAEVNESRDRTLGSSKREIEDDIKKILRRNM